MNVTAFFFSNVDHARELLTEESTRNVTRCLVMSTTWANERVVFEFESDPHQSCAVTAMPTTPVFLFSRPNGLPAGARLVPRCQEEKRLLRKKNRCQ